jgi:CBS domain-containing protein
MNMAENKIGSILVAQENGTLVGIFTEIDAVRTLAEVFSTRLKK